MVETDALTSEFYTGPGDKSILGSFDKPGMNLLTHVSQRRAGGKNQGVLEIRIPVRRLQIDTDEIDGRPDSFGEKGHLQSLLRAFVPEIPPNVFLPSGKVYAGR